MSGTVEISPRRKPRIGSTGGSWRCALLTMGGGISSLNCRSFQRRCGWLFRDSHGFFLRGADEVLCLHSSECVCACVCVSACVRACVRVRVLEECVLTCANPQVCVCVCMRVCACMLSMYVRALCVCVGVCVTLNLPIVSSCSHTQSSVQTPHSRQLRSEILSPIILTELKLVLKFHRADSLRLIL